VSLHDAYFAGLIKQFSPRRVVLRILVVVGHPPSFVQTRITAKVFSIMRRLSFPLACLYRTAAARAAAVRVPGSKTKRFRTLRSVMFSGTYCSRRIGYRSSAGV